MSCRILWASPHIPYTSIIISFCMFLFLLFQVKYFSLVAIKMWSSAPRGIRKYINFDILWERTDDRPPYIPSLSKNICIEYWNRIPRLTLWYILNSHSQVRKITRIVSYTYIGMYSKWTFVSIIKLCHFFTRHC